MYKIIGKRLNGGEIELTQTCPPRFAQTELEAAVVHANLEALSAETMVLDFSEVQVRRADDDSVVFTAAVRKEYLNSEGFNLRPQGI